MDTLNVGGGTQTVQEIEMHWKLMISLPFGSIWNTFPWNHFSPRLIEIIFCVRLLCTHFLWILTLVGPMKFVCFISRSPSNRIHFINSIVTLQIFITSRFIAPVNVPFSWNEIFTTQWPAKLSLMQNVCASPPCLLLHAKPVMPAWSLFLEKSSAND